MPGCVQCRRDLRRVNIFIIQAFEVGFDLFLQLQSILLSFLQPCNRLLILFFLVLQPLKNGLLILVQLIHVLDRRDDGFQVLTHPASSQIDL